MLYVEGNTTVKEVVTTLSTQLATQEGWSIVHSTENKAMLEVSCKFKGQDDLEINKKFYFKIERQSDVLNSIELSIGTEINELKDDFVGNHSEQAKFSWYRKITESYIGDWLTLEYWISMDRNFANIVIQGDPTVSSDKFLISWAYVGACESFEGGDEDYQHNFMLTCGSDEFYEDGEYPKTFGDNTATCITDIGAVGTRTGTPYQAHHVSHYCDSMHIQRNYISSSKYTHKYHASPIVVNHAYDRERGKLQNVLILPREATYHMDEFKETVEENGKKVEKIYVMVALSSPYSVLSNGPRPDYGIAIRKS